MAYKIYTQGTKIVIDNGFTFESYERSSIVLEIKNNTLRFISNGNLVESITDYSMVVSPSATSLTNLRDMIAARLTSGSPASDMAFTNMAGPKRHQVIKGVTDANGQFTATYSTNLPDPGVSAHVIGATDRHVVKVLSLTSTSCQIEVTQRNDVIGLLPTYSKAVGVNVSVVIFEK